MDDLRSFLFTKKQKRTLAIDSEDDDDQFLRFQLKTDKDVEETEQRLEKNPAFQADLVSFLY